VKLYVQCRLRRGDTETTRWIEQRGAKPGALVEVLPDRELWEVAEAFPATALPENMLRHMQQLHRGSLPSVERMA
jgi:hypothetical protein